jgi:hypothetical protein
MAYRYTNTDKWGDSWFARLKPIEKLLFTYLCDNCDIAGFIELNPKKWASDIGLNTKQTEGALKGLGRGLIYSETNDCIFIRNFLKHQKNLPLNEKNNAHAGILKRFELYSYKFKINGNLNEFIEGASKGLVSPYGKGNGIGNEGGLGETKTFTPEEIAFNFYVAEGTKAKEYTDQMSMDYVKLCYHLCQKNKDGSFRLPYVLKIKNQISLDEFSKLYSKSGNNLELIISKIDSLQTNVRYHGKYIDLPMTITNWIRKDNK